MSNYVSWRRTGVTRRMRLKGHDYSEPGYYFVTITEAHHACRFGRVHDDSFVPFPSGDMLPDEWSQLEDRFPDVMWDAFCVMPNHFHAIVGFGVADSLVVSGTSISSVVQAFKSRTTVSYGRGVRENGWPPFDGRLWHTGFYDHIVRTERDLDRIRAYIERNPAQWDEDRFYVPGW